MMFNSVKKKTMKRISIFLLLYMAFVAMSCYEDHSAKDFKIIKPIVIEFAGRKQP